MLLQNEAMIRRLVHEKVDLYNDVDRAAVPVMMALGRIQGDPFRRSSTKKYSSLGEMIRNEPPLTVEAYRRRLASEVLLRTSTHSGASSLAEDALAAALLSEVVDGSANEDVLATHCARLDR